MSAGKYDFKIERGTSFVLSFTYNDENGDPVNLTNWCTRCTWLTNLGVTQKFFPDDPANPTNALYMMNIDPLIGKITLGFPAEITNDFSFATAKYDLEVISTVDEVYPSGGYISARLLTGKVTITQRASFNPDDPPAPIVSCTG